MLVEIMCARNITPNEPANRLGIAPADLYYICNMRIAPAISFRKCAEAIENIYSV